MSSPAGFQYSQADILARWMPSSTRAGVILSPSRDSALGSTPLLPNDSFASDFAPLSTSADSSCIGVGEYASSPGAEPAGDDRPLNGFHSVVSTRISEGQFDSLDEMARKSQDLPLMMKLEQLRKWQQHMQEQLKAHQLEELLSLQEEQQRLLGVVNGPHHGPGESSEMSGAEWDEDVFHHDPEANCWEVPRDTRGLRQEQQLSPQEQLSKAQVHRDHEDGMRDSREDDRRESLDTSCFPDHDDTLKQPKGEVRTESSGREESAVSQDRPIRPGIGGRKQTFEELLEEQLKLEEQRLKSAQQQKSRDGDEAPPKRAFLKRGEGLSRFINNRRALVQKVEVKKDQQPKPQPQDRAICRSNSAPVFTQKGSSNGVPRLPVQRKTATLNKENRARGLCSPPQDIRAESKAARTKVLGSHQKQNTEGPESIQTEPRGRPPKQNQPGRVKEQNNRKAGLPAQALRSRAPNMQPNPVTKQVGALGAPGAADGAPKDKSSASEAESAEVRSGSVERGGVPQDSFELSFREKLQRWECNRRLENMELGEFELLEEAAEELSFSSNSSFVQKVLQMDQQNRQQPAPSELYERRLSSTPIKSPTSGETKKKCGGVRHGDGLACKSAFVKTRGDAPKDEDEQGGESGNQSDVSDMSSGGGSEFGEQEVTVKGSFPEPSNPPYDKRSYQDEESFRDSESDDEESNGGNPNDSTLTEDRGGQRGEVVFDDDDTWNDLEDAAAAKSGDSTKVSPVSRPTASGMFPPERTLMRKVAASKAVEVDKEPETPPASQLMTRLFPSLKPKAQNAPVPPPPAASEFRKPKDETGQQAQSRQLRERLAELEIQIERFQKENAALAKLRQDNERKQEDLRKERLEFEQTKEEELAKFEEHKKEENRKLQRERKLFEKHASAARAIPDKKEREEIQALKQQLVSLQEELRRRESRWNSTHGRLRQQIDSLSQENGSLQEEIRVLEKLRLGALKKSSITVEKDAETLEGPRISENNVPSVTKGVTFASPLDSRGSSCSPPQGGAAAATRGNSKEAAEMKSSLRRSVGSQSSSSLAGRRTEEKPAAVSRNQEQPPNQEHFQDGSLKIDLLPNRPESSDAEEPESAQEVITHPDGKIEKVLASGDRLIVFPNGTRKELSADGLSAKVTFFNGDTKQITADQRVIYYYAEAQTTHITYPDGMEVLHFPNEQTEKLFPDGRKEITFPDQTVKNLFPDGREESVLTDGTIIQVNPDGTKEIHFNTGQREVHTADYKRREYPDGTVKTVYADGRQETRYPTGRLRIKDKDGNVVLDNRG
ncbi:centrosomal P4.1-associated protein isoform 2-T2 [Odontesthes bonariensis]|uniref:centrosomal P4.1-associated protein isoform X2 n=1 Tax=Odontesthes bonariensis TaxID=219752 RepID=UPI003F587BA9